MRLLTRARALPVTIFVLFASLSSIASVHGPGSYHIEKQWIKIWINKNGTVDLLYNLTFVCDSGSFTWIRIGQPNEEFTTWSCYDQYGRNLTTTNIADDWTGVRVNFHDTLQTGQKVTILLLTNVDRMIWEDKLNPGHVSMLFNATSWEVTVINLRIAVVVPENVTADEILTGQEEWDNAYLEQSNWLVYWERSNLAPNKRFQIGVSFPKQYVDKYYSESPGDWLGGVPVWVLPVIGVLAIAVAAGVLAGNLRRIPYSKPGFSMEALGVRKGLMAVEAATLLNVDPRRILTMILFGLMRKTAVRVVEAKPKLVLQVVSTKDLRYYEDWFVDSIVVQSRNGTLSDEKMGNLITKLRREVNGKVKYYCRADTEEYYKTIVEKGWKQVRKAGTPEVKAEILSEELEWLMMAPRFRTRAKRVFRRGEEIPVGPTWWFPYWTTHYAPSKFRGAEGQPSSVKSLPAVQFADAAVTTIESTASRIVVNMEAFSRMLIPVTPSSDAKSTSAPVNRGGCVCACASCACACACASCACACASGGAG